MPLLYENDLKTLQIWTNVDNQLFTQASYVELEEHELREIAEVLLEYALG